MPVKDAIFFVEVVGCSSVSRVDGEQHLGESSGSFLLSKRGCTAVVFWPQRHWHAQRILYFRCDRRSSVCSARSGSGNSWMRGTLKVTAWQLTVKDRCMPRNFSSTDVGGSFFVQRENWTWQTAWNWELRAVIGWNYDWDQSQSLTHQEPMREELPSWFGQSGVAAIVGIQDFRSQKNPECKTPFWCSKINAKKGWWSCMWGSDLISLNNSMGSQE